MSTLSKEASLEKLKLLEEKVYLQENLPHLHGWPWYPWAREFFESRNKVNLLCAANQISKSSTQIRKAIHWATEKSLWPSLWPARRPRQFWYLYPSANQATIEFETKWQEFLPQGKFKTDPKYGWTSERKNKDIFAIRFNSGVNLYFKSYLQDPQTLQTGTVDALFTDEEMPTEVYDELIFRISASDGYFHMVFTATIGQEFWRKALEPNEREVENLPGAWKKQVSLYDCLEYEDGTASPWNVERIQKIKARCKSEAEVLRRVYGKFIKDKGLKYPQFSVSRHMKPKSPVPKDWAIYVGADPGSGGKGRGHPAALIFVAVRPDHRFGRVFLGWRGDGISTTAGDVVNKYMALKNEHDLKITRRWYDWANKDFDLISTSMGEPFEKAEKGHDKGESVVNVLFKNDMLTIDEDFELQKLAGELLSVVHTTRKDKSGDDMVDALRYAVTLIPWDFEGCIEAVNLPLATPAPQKSAIQLEIEERRREFIGNEDEHQRLEEEFEEWNDQYG